MSRVRTVLGDILPEAVGVTLTHEHTILNWPGAELDHRAAFDWDQVVNDVAAELKQGRELFDLATVVDCTPADMGRNPRFMVEVAKASGVNVVATTGFFCESMGVPEHWRRQSLEEIRDFLIRDITDGIVGTKVRCGIIKAATGQDDANPHPTPVGPNGRRVGVHEDRIIRAVGRAQRELGVPLTTHTDPMDWEVTNIGLEQLEILMEEGADPAKICIGHTFFARVEQIEEILSRGAYVQMDNIGTGWRGLSDEAVVDKACALIDKGYLDRILLTFDRFFYQVRGPQPFTGYDPEVAPRKTLDFLPDSFLPLMRSKGLGEQEIRRIMVENPTRLLAF